MKKQTSVKKNFIYNIVYQILILILPLITAPYISRVIGAEGLGIYSYTYSVAHYFVIFAMLGLNNYGNRTIAKYRDNKENLSKNFCSIYAMQLMTSALVIIAYIVYVILFDNKYLIYAIIQLIYVLSAGLDINWFFFGIEKFKLTVTRNSVVKLLSVCSIFVFVKRKEDLILYAVIMVMASFISQISLWPFLRKEIHFVKPSLSDIKKHIKPNLILFIPVIAINLYKVMDKIMLGNMTNVSNVGFYENAEKIINVPLGFITALGTVMLPRISNLTANKEKEKVKEYIDKSMEFSMFLSIPIALGLIAVGKEFAPIFFGEEFVQTGIIIQYLAITVIFISLANVIRTQYLIPNQKDNVFIISTIAGAIINLIINLLLIPKYETIGATIGTIFAELSVMLIQAISVWKEMQITKYLKKLLVFFVKGLIMYVIVYQLKYLNVQTEIIIFLQVVIGVIVYFLLNIKYINSIIDVKKYLKMGKDKND